MMRAARPGRRSVDIKRVVSDERSRHRLREGLHRVGSPPDFRMSFANERTFLAWNRTALALIGGGLAASRLLRLKLDGGRLTIGLILILMGAVAAFTGFIRWRRSEWALRLGERLPRPWLGPAMLASGIAVVAVAALVFLAFTPPPK
jgi:putative membrane protein